MSLENPNPMMTPAASQSNRQERMLKDELQSLHRDVQVLSTRLVQRKKNVHELQTTEQVELNFDNDSHGSGDTDGTSSGGDLGDNRVPHKHMYGETKGHETTALRKTKWKRFDQAVDDFWDLAHAGTKEGRIRRLEKQAHELSLSKDLAEHQMRTLAKENDTLKRENARLVSGLHTGGSQSLTSTHVETSTVTNTI